MIIIEIPYYIKPENIVLYRMEKTVEYWIMVTTCGVNVYKRLEGKDDCFLFSRFQPSSIRIGRKVILTNLDGERVLTIKPIQILYTDILSIPRQESNVYERSKS